MVDLSDLPREITVAVGERREISLPSYADSGNVWSVRRVDGGDVARVSIELGEATSTPASGDGVRQPPELTVVPERAVVAGLASGTATWQLTLARPFGDSTPIATCDLRVLVKVSP
jgi:hypothetical protein